MKAPSGIECPDRPTPWGERGLIRYSVLSYSLWLRHIYYDLRGVKPPKKVKA